MAHGSGESREGIGCAFNAVATIAAKPTRRKGRKPFEAAWTAATVEIKDKFEGERLNYFALMARFNQLGRLLPSESEVIASPFKRAEAKLIIAEMLEVRRGMNGIAKAAAK